ncbi:hypothetical protein AB0K35_25730 [Micromonospora sp. NPDC053740]|uniref:hypothetical protein n=1 Tax=Micromonospora sp. NPDC053740 TaxID=3155173 RepID=UPI0034193091
MDEKQPRYGYGRGLRPLWSPRDRDAEAIRRVLRRAGLRDVGERHLNGFAVEGANSSTDGPEPFAVAYCGTADQPEMTVRSRRVLERTGYQVEADDANANALLVQRQPAREAVPSDRGLLRVAVVCAVVTTVALIASWTDSGMVRFAGGVGSAVFGVVAVFLGGLWYRQRAHLE